MKFDITDINKSVLVDLYQKMLKSRMIEEKMITLLRQGKISKWFSGIGQEAISTGIIMALNKDEFILPMIIIRLIGNISYDKTLNIFYTS